MTTVDVRIVTADDVGPGNPDVNDLFLTPSGDFALVSGAAAVAQETGCVLRWLEREWFLDRSKGVPYISKLLKKGVSTGTVRQILRDQTRQVPDLRRDPDFVINSNTRTRFTTCDLTGFTVDGGPVVVNGVQLSNGGG